jgi:hypothetical protein
VGYDSIIRRLEYLERKQNPETHNPILGLPEIDQLRETMIKDQVEHKPLNGMRFLTGNQIRSAMEKADRSKNKPPTVTK